jgi:hypothetical protein
MEGVEPGWRVPPELRGRPLPQASVEHASQEKAPCRAPLRMVAIVVRPRIVVDPGQSQPSCTPYHGAPQELNCQF